MANIELPGAESDARMELRGLISYIGEGRRIILGTMGVALLFGLVWYAIASRTYQATAVLSAAPGSAASSSTASSTLSNAARLFGLSGTSGAGVSEFTKFQALLTSARLARRLASKTNILQQMYPQSWDQKTHSWKPPSGFFASIKSGIRSLLGLPPWKAPDADSVMGYLQSNLDQELSIQTSLLTLTVTAQDPKFAQTFLATVHREADNILRDAARTRSQRRIAYLENTLRAVSAVDQREALIGLLDQEEQTSMMIESDPNYAADMVDAPYALPYPVSPTLLVTIIASAASGLILGLILYLVLRRAGLHDLALRRPQLRWREILPALGRR